MMMIQWCLTCASLFNLQKQKKSNTTEKNISYSNISHQCVTVIRNMCRERCKLFWLLCTFYLSTVTYISRLKYLTFCWVYVVFIEKLRPKILSTFTTFCNIWTFLYNRGNVIEMFIFKGFFFSVAFHTRKIRHARFI